MKKHNFSAGPSILPNSVIKEAAKSVIELNNTGLSLLEISHRGPDFIKIINNWQNILLILINFLIPQKIIFKDREIGQ